MKLFATFAFVGLSVFSFACSNDVFESSAPDGDVLSDAATPDSKSPIGDGGTADVESDADAEVVGDGGSSDSGPTFRRVFISNGHFDGSLGGAIGADSKCQAAADTATPHPLGGVWKAWVSTSTSSPHDDVDAGGFTKSIVPWKLIDGKTLIANDWADLVSGGLENPIDMDEDGNIVSWSGGVDSTGIVWTSTGSDGRFLSYDDCSDFSDGTGTHKAAVGYIQNGYPGTYNPDFWTNAQYTAGYLCSSQLSLLCFEQ